jgi:hypothetical protein
MTKLSSSNTISDKIKGGLQIMIGILMADPDPLTSNSEDPDQASKSGADLKTPTSDS